MVRSRSGTLAALALVGAAAVGAVLLAPAGHSARAAGNVCAAAPFMPTMARPMPHVTARLAKGGEFTIVALGSSSTFGTGATKPSRNYPSRLAALLEHRYPGVNVHVINLGVGGEEAQSMAKRIETQVLPAKPDLVIWQVGTNGVLDGDDAIQVADVVRIGIEEIRASGGDVMLMNPQYAPAMLKHWNYRLMLHEIDAVAYAENVPLLPRFSIMRQWVDEGFMTLGVMLSRDRLHMTDVSYNCLAHEIAAGLDTFAPPREDEALAEKEAS